MEGTLTHIEAQVSGQSKTLSKLSSDILSERDARKDAITEILDTQRKAERYWMAAAVIFLAKVVFERIWTNIPPGIPGS